MSHIRTEVRNAVVAKLRAAGGFGLVEPGLRILRGIQEDQYPIAFVSVSDAGMPVGKNPPGSRPLQRAIKVDVVVGSVNDDVDLDEDLDSLAGRIETALSDPSTLGFGKVLDWSYVGTEMPSAEKAAEYGFAAAKVTFRGTVTTQEGQPSTNIHF